MTPGLSIVHEWVLVKFMVYKWVLQGPAVLTDVLEFMNSLMFRKVCNIPKYWIIVFKILNNSIKMSRMTSIFKLRDQQCWVYWWLPILWCISMEMDGYTKGKLVYVWIRFWNLCLHEMTPRILSWCQISRSYILQLNDESLHRSLLNHLSLKKNILS